MEQKEKYLILIHKYITKQLSASEKKAFDEWLAQDPIHQHLLESTESLWESSASYKETYEPDVKAGWEKLSKRINSKSHNDGKTVVLRPSRSRWWLAAAAVLLLVGSLGWFIANDNSPEWITADTAGETIQLSDGSMVTLNDNSVLMYPKRFESTGRVVRLQGEAFFNVTKAKKGFSPFKVETAKADVEVLGTSFNVRAYESLQITEVTVRSGKVSLAGNTNTNEKIILQANEKGALAHNNGKLTVSKDEQLNTLSWKTGKLVFDGTPIKEVIPEMEKFFAVKINWNGVNIKDCLHTDDIVKSDNLKDILESWKTIYNIRFEQNDAGFILTEGKCK